MTKPVQRAFLLGYRRGINRRRAELREMAYDFEELQDNYEAALASECDDDFWSN